MATALSIRSAADGHRRRAWGLQLALQVVCKDYDPWLVTGLGGVTQLYTVRATFGPSARAKHRSQ
jgi:hypothetical protein